MFKNLPTFTALLPQTQIPNPNSHHRQQQVEQNPRRQGQAQGQKDE